MIRGYSSWKDILQNVQKTNKTWHYFDMKCYYHGNITVFPETNVSKNTVLILKNLINMVHMPKTWYYHGKCKKTAWFSMVHIVKQHCITMVKFAKTSSINVTCYQAIGKSLVCFACSVLVSVSLGVVGLWVTDSHYPQSPARVCPNHCFQSISVCAWSESDVAGIETSAEIHLP